MCKFLVAFLSRQFCLDQLVEVKARHVTLCLLRYLKFARRTFLDGSLPPLNLISSPQIDTHWESSLPRYPDSTSIHTMDSDKCKKLVELNKDIWFLVFEKVRRVAFTFGVDYEIVISPHEIVAD